MSKHVANLGDADEVLVTAASANLMSRATAAISAFMPSAIRRARAGEYELMGIMTPSGVFKEPFEARRPADQLRAADYLQLSMCAFIAITRSTSSAASSAFNA